MATKELNQMVCEGGIQILVDKNLNESTGIVKPLTTWPEAHLLHLQELIKDELKERKAGRPFWV